MFNLPALARLLLGLLDLLGYHVGLLALLGFLDLLVLLDFLGLLDLFGLLACCLACLFYLAC